MHTINDTIIAPATPPGESALAVLRLSGPDAWPIFSRLLAANTPPPPPRLMTRGHLLQSREALAMDEVLYCRYCAPASYTGEDMVEIFCHGSPFLSRTLTAALTAAGARPADPGEFTQRAYLNGKMDLVQAESVAELISARSEQARQAALRHLSGHLSAVFHNLQRELLEVLSLVEANIDFSAEDIDLLESVPLKNKIQDLHARLRNLQASYRIGRVVRQGLRVAVVGQPNAGKSSLLNALLGREDIIVDSRPGTTRDYIEKEWEYKGLRLILTDTAGLRETADPVEKIGVRKTREIIKQAHAAVYLADGNAAPDPEDEKIFTSLETPEKLFVYSKADLPAGPGVRDLAAAKGRLAVSVKQPATLSALLEAVTAPWAQQDQGQELLTSERQAQAAAEAAESLAQALAHLEAGTIQEEILAADLRRALQALGRIIGRVTDDDVLQEIFGKFCIGK